MKDGSVFLMRDYWVANGKIHYVNGGGENELPLDEVDIQKTVDVNAKRGITVTLKASPDPTATPAINGQPNSTSQSNTQGPAQPPAKP